MKCEVCLERLEEYLDGELPADDQEQISEHLITCAGCAASFSTLTAEQELFSRYDRELEVTPFLWTRIAQHTVAAEKSVRLGWRARLGGLFAMPAFAGAVALLLIAIALGVVYLSKETTSPKQPEPKIARTDSNTDEHGKQNDPKPEMVVSRPRPKRKVKPAVRVTSEQSDVLSADLGYLDIDDRDTAKHLEQTQILLRSIRNVNVSDGDEEIDVSYDKALSRRLLNENVVLRRDAEMKAKFPTKTLLADLEPFLIDIANLPDHARPEDVRVIKERVQKTEIVAALMSYQGRDTNNR
jgi:Putative zinc-finger